ncbi:MAG: extracellular solute-binding protein [Eubacteriales bacterium]|nr:extracellular solute-binding protein [Eubacteriales bacterium]
MNKWGNRGMAMVLAAVMGLGAAGCGSAQESGGTTQESQTEAEGSFAVTVNETGYPITNEEITIEVSGKMPSGLEDWTNLAVIDEYAERLGIRLNCNFYATDWNTQLTLMVAGDEVPDLIANGEMNISDLNTWGEEGYFLDLSQYLDVMPNLKAYFEKYPELEAYCTTSDGHIYGLPKLKTDMTDRLTRTFVNRVWLDNLGLEAPTSIEELYETLVVFKEQDANGNGDPTDEIPLLFTGSTNAGYSAIERTLLDAFGIYTSDINYILQADESGTVYLANTGESYQEYLAFLAKLYEEGLMEQEAFTLTDNEIMQKEQGDVYGVFGTGSAPFVLANQDISYDANWMALSGLSSSVNQDRYAGIASPVSSLILTAVGADTEYPEAMARFLDYFYTEEGMLSAMKGYEGVTFDYVTDELIEIDVAEMRAPEGYASGEEYRFKGAVINEGLNVLESNADREALFEIDLDVLESKEVVEKYGWAALVADAYRQDGVTGVSVYPVVAYTSEESDQRGTLYTDINTYLMQAKAQFITGEKDVEADWDAYVTTLEQMGLSSLLEIEQEAYNRYAEIMK